MIKKKKNKNSWKTTATIKNLIRRSQLLRKIRNFFYKKEFLELETPIFSRFPVNDYYLQPFKTKFLNHSLDFKNKSKKNYINLWLNTSPECHMKRFLSCCNSKKIPIYQICKSFRNGEYGKNHHPEFTILEWYRPDYTIFHLMKEIEEFLMVVFKFPSSKNYSYKKIFKKYLNLNPLKCNKRKLKKKFFYFKQENLLKDFSYTKSELLQILFSIGIEPYLGKKNPTFIYHYPKNQALMSKINKKNNLVCERFELFFKGLELGNGFYELLDYKIQKKRFLKNNKKRKLNNINIRQLDKYFLESLKNKKFSKCSGVALGLDRLIMLFLKKKNISNVLSFSIKNC